MSKSILKKAGSRSQFHKLVPKVKGYILNYLFKEHIEEVNTKILKKLNTEKVRRRIYEIFVKVLQELGKVKEEYEMKSEKKIRDTATFHTTKDVYPVTKTVFNCLPYDSELERKFMHYLDNSPEVEAYTRMFWRIPIRITYFHKEKGRKYYIPDFIVKANDKKYIPETIGNIFFYQCYGEASLPS